MIIAITLQRFSLHVIFTFICNPTKQELPTLKLDTIHSPSSKVWWHNLFILFSVNNSWWLHMLVNNISFLGHWLGSSLKETELLEVFSAGIFVPIYFLCIWMDTKIWLVATYCGSTIFFFPSFTWSTSWLVVMISLSRHLTSFPLLRLFWMIELLQAKIAAARKETKERVSVTRNRNA